MRLSKRTAYLSMFCFLDKFWWMIQDEFQHSKLDDMAGFLGDMDPYLFKDTLSADPASWNDLEKESTILLNKYELNYGKIFGIKIVHRGENHVSMSSS